MFINMVMIVQVVYEWVEICLIFFFVVCDGSQELFIGMSLVFIICVIIEEFSINCLVVLVDDGFLVERRLESMNYGV